MSVAKEIREQLSVCADCINCKLIVWKSSDDADKVADRTDFETYRTDDGKYHFAVHCGWLKQKMQAPTQIIKCEGKKPQKVIDE